MNGLKTGSSDVQATAPESSPAEAPLPLAPATVLWYSVANLGYGAFFAFNNATLPLFLKAYTSNPVILGLMGSTHSVEGAIIQPLIGNASDGLRSRLGRRRPFILIFIPICVVLLLVTPLAHSLPGSVRLSAIIACIFLFTVSFNIAQDPYLAMMPDITPPYQRGMVTAVWTLLGVIGQAGLVLSPAPPALKFSMVAILMLATTAITCIAVREPPSTGSRSHTAQPAADLVKALRSLKWYRQATIALSVFFCAGAGIGAVLPFLTLFVTRITHCTDHQAEIAFLVMMAATAIGVIPFGHMTDRLGAKPVLLIGFVLIAIAAANGLWIRSLAQVDIVLALAGLGNAAQSAAAYPLLTGLVPSSEIGFYTGLQTTMLSIAQPFTVVVTGLLIRQGGYRAIFGVCSAAIVLAILLLIALRPAAAAGEIRARVRAGAEIG